MNTPADNETNEGIGDVSGYGGPAPICQPTGLTVNQANSPWTGTVSLTVAAPAGGAAVSLYSSNTSIATVLANVTVPGGFLTENFNITKGQSTGTTVICASYDGGMALITVTVN